MDGADAVCTAGQADAALVDALEALVLRLEALPPDVWGVRELILRARAILRATVPPQLLDLSALGDGDAWAGPAREVARDLPADAISPLVRLLSELGGRRPTATWWQAIGAALLTPPAKELIEGWLRVAEMTDVVPPDPRRQDSGATLFGPGAEDVVRATVLTARLLGEDRAPARRLANLVLRGAATSRVPGMTASLSLRVAGAGIESLAARGGPGDTAALEELLEDLTRRDLVRKVGAALSREGAARARSAEIAQARSRAAARAADPAPRRERAGRASEARHSLTAVLAPLGFTAAGGTWRRRHADRVDVVAVGLRGSDLQLEYGTWFDLAHPEDEPWHVPAERVQPQDLDVCVVSEHRSAATGVAGLAAHVQHVVVPFIDSLGRWELVRAWLDHGAGTPKGARPLARPEHLGLLALRLGDRAVALRRIGDHVRELQQSPRPMDHAEALEQERERWGRLLSEAEGLPQGDA